MPRIVLLLTSVLLLLGASPASLRADEEIAEEELRAEARRSVLVDWSRDAETATLNLGPRATEMLDLWLDYCRSKYAGRQKPSPRFTGVPHETWGVTDGTLVFRPMFVSLEIARAGIEPRDVPGLIDALSKDVYPKAVGVEGDDEVSLRTWGLMLLNEAVENLLPLRQSRSHQAAWTGASQRLRDHLLATIERTEPLGDRFARPGTPAGARLVWLHALRATGLHHAGSVLIDVREKLGADGSAVDAAVLSHMIAGCGGARAESFVKAELASGDWERQKDVLEGMGPLTSLDALRKVAEFARKTSEDAHARIALNGLRRAGAPGGQSGDHVARLLRQLFQQIPDRSPRKLLAAVTLVEVGHTDERVIAFLETWLEKLTREEGLSTEADRLRRLIDDAKSRAGEE